MNGFYNGKRVQKMVRGFYGLCRVHRAHRRRPRRGRRTGEVVEVNPFSIYPLDPQSEDYVDDVLHQVQAFGGLVKPMLADSLLRFAADTHLEDFSRVPLLIAHGERNFLHPPTEAEELYNAYPGPKQIFWLWTPATRSGWTTTTRLLRALPPPSTNCINPSRLVQELVVSREKNLITDSQVHIWEVDRPDRPWPKPLRNQPQLPNGFSAAEMIAEMDAAGVDRAVIVPPTWIGEDNSTALEASPANPGRFAVMGRFDPMRPDAARGAGNWSSSPTCSAFGIPSAPALRTGSSTRRLSSLLGRCESTTSR